MTILAVAAAWMPAAAMAQAEAPFTGTYVGGEAGALEHHIYLETQSGGTTTGRYHRAWGVGGGLFVGHDVVVSEHFRIGGEAGLTTGGGDNVVPFAGGAELRLEPRYGYRVSLHGGVVLGSSLFVYASGGYGGNNYRIRNTAGVADVHEWGSSFVVGAGAEYRISPRLGIRIDYKHVDNQSHQFFVGVPVRF
ncbi:outer membrane beta-barrel protein [Sphingomonas sp. KR3-1]|uniref:outer membrane protein n=1 Tax=Sphingomonas sp. KR3-1 TaxID=3156611 RepID=UPI0032B51E58